MGKCKGRAREALSFIRRYIATHNIAPSVREIQRELGLSSPSAAWYIVRKLASQGHIVRHPKRARAIAVSTVQQAPLLGELPSSRPLGRLTRETLSIPVDERLIPHHQQRLYALIAADDSMLDALILKGDILIVVEGERPRAGQLVVVYHHKSRRTQMGKVIVPLPLQVRLLGGSLAGAQASEGEVTLYGVVSCVMRQTEQQVQQQIAQAGPSM